MHVKTHMYVCMYVYDYDQEWWLVYTKAFDNSFQLIDKNRVLKIQRTKALLYTHTHKHYFELNV